MKRVHTINKIGKLFYKDWMTKKEWKRYKRGYEVYFQPPRMKAIFKNALVA